MSQSSIGYEPIRPPKIPTCTRMVARKPGVNRCDWSHRGDNTKYRDKK